MSGATPISPGSPSSIASPSKAKTPNRDWVESLSNEERQDSILRIFQQLKPDVGGTPQENQDIWKQASKYENTAFKSAGSKGQYLEKVTKRVNKLQRESNRSAPKLESVEEIKAAHMQKQAQRIASAAARQADICATVAAAVAAVVKEVVQKTARNPQLSQQNSEQAKLGQKEELVRGLREREATIQVEKEQLEKLLAEKEAEQAEAVEAKVAAVKQAEELKLKEAAYESKAKSELAAVHAHYSSVIATNFADYQVAIEANSNLVRVYADHVKVHLKKRVAKITADLAAKDAQCAALSAQLQVAEMQR